MNREIISMPVFMQRADISSNFAVGSWKTEQLHEISAKMSKMWTKYVFEHYLEPVIILH